MARLEASHEGKYINMFLAQKLDRTRKAIKYRRSKYDYKKMVARLRLKIEEAGPDTASEGDVGP